MSNESDIVNNQQIEISYYEKQLKEVAKANVKLEMAIAGVHHELRQKRLGYTLLYELQQSIVRQKDVADILEYTAEGSVVGQCMSIVWYTLKWPSGSPLSAIILGLWPKARKTSPVSISGPINP